MSSEAGPKVHAPSSGPHEKGPVAGPQAAQTLITALQQPDKDDCTSMDVMHARTFAVCHQNNNKPTKGQTLNQRGALMGRKTTT